MSRSGKPDSLIRGRLFPPIVDATKAKPVPFARATDLQAQWRTPHDRAAFRSDKLSQPGSAPTSICRTAREGSADWDSSLLP